MDRIVLDNKKGIILGVRTKRSIAYAVAEEMHKAGAKLMLTYENEDVKERVRYITKELDGILLEPCEVTDDNQIRALFYKAEGEFGSLDFLVHSIAYAPKGVLEKSVSQVTDQEFNTAMKISAKSLADLAGYAAPIMHNGGSIVAMTYFASEKVVPPYGFMGVVKSTLDAYIKYLAKELGEKGIRVNGVSAGPIMTPAARAIPGFVELHKKAAEKSPLQKSVEPQKVAKAVMYLCSDLSSDTTGEILHVDSGYNIMGI